MEAVRKLLSCCLHSTFNMKVVFEIARKNGAVSLTDLFAKPLNVAVI